MDRYNISKRAEGYGRQFLLAARAGHVFSDLYDFGTTVMKFTVAQGAQDHCAPMAPQTRNQVVFDWLDRFL